jgi:WhiB family redox-sensing transcriptional regulator
MAMWMDAAECRGEDTELFFPAGHRGEYTLQIKKAKAVCGRCPVRGECLQAALGRREKHGIWGGLTDDERARLRRNDRRRVRPTLVEPKPTKECRRCLLPQTLGQFYVRSGRKDGRDSYCRTCCSELARERAAAKKANDQTTDLKGIAS